MMQPSLVLKHIFLLNIPKDNFLSDPRKMLKLKYASNRGGKPCAERLSQQLQEELQHTVYQLE